MKISDIDIASYSTRYLAEMFNISFITENILSDRKNKKTYLFGIIEDYYLSRTVSHCVNYYNDICQLMHYLGFPIELVNPFLRDVIQEKNANNYSCSYITLSLDSPLRYYRIDGRAKSSGVIYLISLYRKEGATSA